MKAVIRVVSKIFSQTLRTSRSFQHKIASAPLSHISRRQFADNSHSPNNNDTPLEEVLSKLDSKEKICEFFNEYYEEMPETDLVKFAAYVSRSSLLSDEDVDELSLVCRNLFEVIDNVQGLENLSLLIEFLIENIPLSNKNFMVSLDGLIRKNAKTLVENGYIRLISKYYSFYSSDLKAYNESSWQFLWSAKDKIKALPFIQVTEIFGHFSNSSQLKDDTLKFFAETLSEKHQSSQFEIDPNTDDYDHILRLFYISRILKEKFSETQKGHDKLSYNEENMGYLSNLTQIGEEILRKANVDTELTFKTLREEEKMTSAEYENHLKNLLEKEELGNIIENKIKKL